MYIDMALHRDIYWLGRQWAVTGYGIQACDQKRKGQFDIAANRLWDNAVLEGIRALAWLNIADFENALAIARKHFPEQPPTAAPPEERVLGLIEKVLQQTSRTDTGVRAGRIATAQPEAETFALRVDGWPAKLVPQWRLRITRPAATGK
jgi:hypothetical protein